MKKKNKISFLMGYIALSSGSIWFGVYIARMFLTYQLLEPTEPILRDYFNSANLPAIAEVISPLVDLSFFSYLVMVISFTFFLIFSGINLKSNGWLFIVAAIVYITLPFESVLLINDYKLVLLFLNEQFSSENVIKLIIDRTIKLSSFPIILILSYLTIPYFLIFKPFTTKTNNEN